MKKNCNNCQYLGYYEKYYEESGDSGFFCEGRDYFSGSGCSYKKENRHLEKLQDDKYRNFNKKCFKPKEK